IRRSEGFVGTGVALFEAAREQGIEGIVAKRLDSLYQPGARSPAWVKVKAFRSMDCVIGGWTAGQGGRQKTLGALLIGVYHDGELPERVPAVLEVEGRRIKLTNLEKVLFPEDGYTKADLIRYYTEVSPYLVPWLRDRPLTLKPFPDGIHGAHFYQKNKPEFTPS